MSLHLTRPFGMALLDWADQITHDLDPFGSVGKLENENDWQEWAANILNNSTLKYNFPIPYDFTDWHEWAELFCRSGGS
jgi:hypothetical protein